mmetsp:Transcript_27529/g.75225  ORF Transcript_27529/g.75225 Transcript_27529/m.75225 type:complete len:88 (+) Transcript_27529:147-410(+)|eukprot:scaffold258414_cov26-Tisochrysis_lutea.AAC.1
MLYLDLEAFGMQLVHVPLAMLAGARVLDHKPKTPAFLTARATSYHNDSLARRAFRYKITRPGGAPRVDGCACAAVDVPSCSSSSAGE